MYDDIEEKSRIKKIKNWDVSCIKEKLRNFKILFLDFRVY